MQNKYKGQPRFCQDSSKSFACLDFLSTRCQELMYHIVNHNIYVVKKTI